jgi:hypothetical protein
MVGASDAAISNDLDRYARRGLWALPVWAALLLVGTWTHQPDYQTDFWQYAQYITTTQFRITHLVASILGAGIGILGLIALFVVLAHRQTLRLAGWALVLAVIGNVLVTAVFGVATFAQPAIGNAYLSGHSTEAIAINSDVYGPVLFATALPGLLLFTIGVVLFGVAVARSDSFPSLAGIAFALSGLLFALIGFAIDQVQTVGAALMLVSTIWIARTARLRTAFGPERLGGAAERP